MKIYKPGESIFEAGGEISGIFFIQTGLVKECIRGQDSKPEIIRFIKEGNALGQIGVEDEKYLISATSFEETMICYFENKVFTSMFEVNPKIIFDLMLYYSDVYCKTVYRLKSISQMNLREKIAESLLYIYNNFNNGGNESSFSLTREQIASLACTTPEQVSRQLTEFEKENLIEKRGRKIIILAVEELRNIINKY